MISNLKISPLELTPINENLIILLYQFQLNLSARINLTDNDIKLSLIRVTIDRFNQFSSLLISHKQNEHTYFRL